ncbi:MAG: superoxide dismutase [Fe] [Candidatus Puniceispirillum sp.]|nr:superoxide dismutase [Fe] [Candidatus Puniceispirillum sp.]
MAFQLPELPYAANALEPYISQQTLEFHHGKHQKTYVDNLNRLVQAGAHETKTLEQIILDTAGNAQEMGIFNNAAQVWNHTFYWHCMSGQGGGMPGDRLEAALIKDFGSVDAFKAAFKDAALTQFGSGWAWLVMKDGKLSIMKTANADLPMAHGAKALLTCDVWEHAYYLDYQNRRADYVDVFFKHLVNWDFVQGQFEG